MVGSPPRVRSRRGRLEIRVEEHGITSACAEQTTGTGGAGSVMWDHLRVCGADGLSSESDVLESGSPPRVRSRPGRGLHEAVPRRITSACAEQTRPVSRRISRMRDHLRVCGADDGLTITGKAVPGSPPRVRSRR